MDNLAQQMEEQEVLTSIFEDIWKQCENVPDTYSIKLAKDVVLWITLNESYPSNKPPQYELWAPNLTKCQKDFVDTQFNKIYTANEGCPVIFQWIEELKDIISGKITTNEDKPKESVSENRNNKQLYSRKQHLTKSTSRINPIIEFKLEIVHGPPITDRKSTFQGHACKVTHAEHISKLLEELRKNKKIRDATHNILAYRIVKENNIILQDSDEDGENHAGGRLLHLLEMLDVKNVAVVVTRWYGGIKLGPDRFKHINNAGRQALSQAGFIR